jgi:hypothetical protein
MSAICIRPPKVLHKAGTAILPVKPLSSRIAIRSIRRSLTGNSLRGRELCCTQNQCFRWQNTIRESRDVTGIARATSAG